MQLAVRTRLRYRLPFYSEQAIVTSTTHHQGQLLRQVFARYHLASSSSHHKHPALSARRRRQRGYAILLPRGNFVAGPAIRRSPPNHPFPALFSSIANDDDTQQQQQHRTAGPKMSTDDEYINFLDKANQDPSSSGAQARAQGAGSGSKKPFKTTDKGAQVPQPLLAVTKEAFYTSDADEPFVPVALAWEGGEGLPDEEELARLIDHWDPANAEVEILDPLDWDRDGQYAEVVDAVRKAGKGNDVRVYRVARDGARAEYFVVTRADGGKETRLVGVKALAVES